MIFTVHGKGSFVARAKAVQSLDRLRGFAEAMVGGEVVNHVIGHREVPAGQVVGARLELPPDAIVHEIRRVRHLDGAPISLDVTYVPRDIGEQLAKADLAGRDIFLILENDLHRPLGMEELSIEAVSADTDLAQHLRVAKGAPLLKIERLTRAEDGAPLDFEYVFHRGDTFRYRLTVAR